VVEGCLGGVNIPQSPQNSRMVLITGFSMKNEGFLLHRVAQPPYASRWLRELRETGVEFLDTRLTFNSGKLLPAK